MVLIHVFSHLTHIPLDPGFIPPECTYENYNDQKFLYKVSLYPQCNSTFGAALVGIFKSPLSLKRCMTVAE